MTALQMDIATTELASVARVGRAKTVLPRLAPMNACLVESASTSRAFVRVLGLVWIVHTSSAMLIATPTVTATMDPVLAIRCLSELTAKSLFA